MAQEANGTKSNRLVDFFYKQTVKEVLGVLAIGFTLITVASLVSFTPVDTSANNLIGVVGGLISNILVKLFGVAAYVVPVLTLAFGILCFQEGTWRGAGSLFGGGGLFIFSAAVLLFVFYPESHKYEGIPSGGIIGSIVAGKLFLPLLAKPGSTILAVSILFSSILLATRLSVVEFWSLFLVAIEGIYSLSKELFAKANREILAIIGKTREKLKKDEKLVITDAVLEEEPPPTVLEPVSLIEALEEEPEDPKIIKQKREQETSADNDFEAEQADLPFLPNNEDEIKLPPISLLADAEKIDLGRSDEELLVNSKILTKKLADFGIAGRVTMVLPGPVITLYEFEPAAGIKVSRIVGLSDDLAMGLRALSVRILAPVPGKAVVGIEVPNRIVEPVNLKKIVTSPEFKESDSKVTLALGKDTSGIPVVTDLATIPHLLIAGATGSGKSVGLNAMIMSILFKASPSEVKFIMIDPKMLELSIYDGIPHLIAPVVTNPKKAANALRWAVEEMERRYTILADLGFRNIATYNKWAKEFLKEKEEEKEEEKEREGLDPQKIEAELNEDDEPPVEQDVKILPYIVVIIDELADLMMVASKDVEDALARLAQMARAAGIHLIVATQRPSVDVLTGLIKANFPARISYQVTSRIDSRTILDSIGAEKLLGKGDLLFLPPGTSRLQRIHGPMVSDKEIKETTDHLREQGKPVYNESILKAREKTEEISVSDDDDDEYFEQAVEIISTTRQASISMIQRRLRIGYNRAARIIETMEAKGMVGPSDGAKPRQVLIPPSSVDE